MGVKFNPFIFSGLDFAGGSGGGGYAGWKTTVATEAGLPTVGNTDGDARTTQDTNKVWVWDGTASRWIETGFTAVAAGSVPNANGYSLDIANVGANRSERQLVLQPADGSNPGILSILSQDIAGVKTFVDDAIFSGTLVTVNNDFQTGTLTVTNATTLDTALTGPLKATAGLVSSSAIDLTTEVTGILPIAEGGTNSSTALNSNRFIISLGGSLVEQAAVTASRALVSDVNGLPVASATTSAELAFVSGVTSAVQTQLNAKIPNSEKAAALGVATLDAGGKVPAAQLPNSLMDYLGTWAASTNTPTLANGTGNAGDVYVASNAGTVNFGAGAITFAAGDWVIYSGAIWEKSINSNAVASVNGFTGVVSLDTDDISEGTALYFTDERAQDAVGSILTNTTTIDFTYNDAGNAISAGVNALSLTDGLVSATAAIARTKLADGTANHVLINSGAGVMSSEATLAVSRGGTALGTTPSNGQLLIGNATNYTLATLTGTTNQVDVTNGSGSITLSLPQSIDTASSPTFGGLTLTAFSGLVKASVGVLSASALVNADVDAAAAIDRTKLASGTGSHVIINTAGGVLSSEASLAVSRGGSGLGTTPTDGQLLIGNGTNYTLATITGTASQVDVANSSGSITLSLPQSIATASSPTFAGLTLTSFSGVVKATAGVLAASAIVNADVDAAAAIDRTKLASGTGNHVLINTGPGVMSSEATLAVSRGGTALGTTPSNGQLLVGNGTDYTLATITAGTNISVTNGAGTITINSTASSTGDINQTSFTAADNQVAVANVTGLAFANASVRSFECLLSIARSTDFQQYVLHGIQKSASWEMDQSLLGDDCGLIFTITSAGQVQYTSTSTGSSATVKFRAIVTSV